MRHPRWLSGIVAAAALVASLAGAGCVSDIEVDYAYGPGTPIEGFGPTYAWKPDGQALTGNPALDDPAFRTFLLQEIEVGFGSRGYSRAVGGAPDFRIDYELVVDLDFQKQGVHVTPYRRGSLILVVSNPSDGHLMWEGTAHVKVDEKLHPDQRRERIREGVRRVLKNFPQYK